MREPYGLERFQQVIDAGDTYTAEVGPLTYKIRKDGRIYIFERECEGIPQEDLPPEEFITLDGAIVAFLSCIGQLQQTTVEQLHERVTESHQSRQHLRLVHREEIKKQ